ncbi:hypothetical protein B2G51_08910 [Leptospira santarosai]|nr:hypothetical protein B2G51_08910 [Leptospira santarosai]EKS07640.1 hypothetical protein LEP1GSC071_4187 [Leptospira santarosai str. JET]ONF85857.1 hypothetical protein BWD13_11885 [Leptospira santarosai serovar Grippotyphosa]
MNVKFDLNPFQFRIRHDVSFFVQKNFAFLKGFGVRFEFRFLRPRGWKELNTSALYGSRCGSSYCFVILKFIILQNAIT